MFAGGARLEDILENLCDRIDAQAGNQHFGGNADVYGRHAPSARTQPSTFQRLDRRHRSVQDWTW